MKILVGNIPLPANRFLVDLNDALAVDHEITHSHDQFWDMDGKFDVVQLHFPEYMTPEIEQAYYQNALTEDMLVDIEERLAWWAQRSTIVITRHVLLPHFATTNPLWERLYELVYRYVSGVVHFAQPSIDEFRERYADTNFIHGSPAHCIVEHQNYSSLPNVVTREQARRKLGISENARVMLVFGHVRNDDEKRLILSTFQNMRVPGKMLLCSRWRESLARVSWVRLKYWLRDLKRLYLRLHPRFHFNYGFVEEDDTQLYLNAADVLFIPRLKVLNSGNITLGMTFGKVVVGPDSLDVGHLLSTTGNVVFDPDRPETAAEAMRQAMDLAAKGDVGKSNRELALNEWSARQCADRYSEFFTQIKAAPQTASVAASDQACDS